MEVGGRIIKTSQRKTNTTYSHSNGKLKKIDSKEEEKLGRVGRRGERGRLENRYQSTVKK
jgi:hypothetical protein